MNRSLTSEYTYKMGGGVVAGVSWANAEIAWLLAEVGSWQLFDTTAVDRWPLWIGDRLHKSDCTKKVVFIDLVIIISRNMLKVKYK